MKKNYKRHFRIFVFILNVIFIKGTKQSLQLQGKILKKKFVKLEK